jgi:hypothetical protein
VDGSLLFWGFIFMEHYKNLSLNDIEGEKWLPMVGFDNYWVSNLGRIKSFSFGKFKIKAQRHPKNGYLLVSIWKNNKEKKVLVHRAVAMAFLGVDSDKKTVNHKNGIKQDNSLENLEWMTQSENAYHSFKYLNRKTTNLKGKGHPKSKHVFQFDLSGNLIAKYANANEAALFYKIGRRAISAVCNGRYKTYKKYRWSYENNP